MVRDPSTLLPKTALCGVSGPGSRADARRTFRRISTAPRDREWAVAVSGWGRRAHPVFHLTTDQRCQLREPGSSVQWDASSFGSSTSRATPTYFNGKLITVTGYRRHVVALNPGNGELLWSHTEPNTWRWEYSMRRVTGRVSRSPRSMVETSSISRHPASSFMRSTRTPGQPLEDWVVRSLSPDFRKRALWIWRGPHRWVGPLGRPEPTV